MSKKSGRFSYAIDELAEQEVVSEEIQTSQVVVTSEPTETSQEKPERPKRTSSSKPRQQKSEAKVKSQQKKTSKQIVTSEQPVVSLNVQNLEELLQPPLQRGKKDTEGTGRMSIPREQTTLRLRPELKRAAAAAAALEGIGLGDLIERALVEYLKEKS